MSCICLYICFVNYRMAWHGIRSTGLVWAGKKVLCSEESMVFIDCYPSSRTFASLPFQVIRKQWKLESMIDMPRLYSVPELIHMKRA